MGRSSGTSTTRSTELYPNGAKIWTRRARRMFSFRPVLRSLRSLRSTPAGGCCSKTSCRSCTCARSPSRAALAELRPQSVEAERDPEPRRRFRRKGFEPIQVFVVEVPATGHDHTDTGLIDLDRGRKERVRARAAHTHCKGLRKIEPLDKNA